MTQRSAAVVLGLALGAAALGPATVHANPPLSDSEDGMTCRHYVLGANLEWRRAGGDWVDAGGKDYGDAPFAQSSSGPSDAGTVRWDITKLAQAWMSGLEPKGAVFLRTLAGSRNVLFHSREGVDAATRPALLIDWSDGTTSRIDPSTDTYFSCSSRSSKGQEALLRLGPKFPVALVFPVEPRKGAEIRRAQLVLTVGKPGGAASIGVFRPAPPWAREAKRETGLATAYPGDRGIERNPDVIFASGFEGSGWQKGWSEVSARSTARTVNGGSGNGFEPIDGMALEVTIKEKGKLGLNMHYNFADHPAGEPEEAYFRYYLRFGENWGGREGGKLPGFSGTYDRAGWGMRRSDGTNGWSARGSFTDPFPTGSPLFGLVGIGSYVYQADMKKQSGDHLGWNLGPSGLLKKNRWYSVEQYVKLNRPDQADGMLRAWVDGHLVFEQTGIRFRATPELRIESVWMNVYHGGTRTSPRDMSLYIDNFVVARKYIGPMVK